MKLVQFGAGNIGRSFIGQIFSRAGWDVVFVDVAEPLTALLNERRYYTVVIKREGAADEPRRIGPVRAVNGRDPAAVEAELAGADLAAVSVGKAALPGVLPLIAAGLRARSGHQGDFPPVRPLDIIIAENDREAPALFRSVLRNELGPDYPLETLAGFVETSIGKMVPVMKAADLAADPLLLFAEEYETLIVDRRGFRGPIPDIPAIHPVESAAAYVDRKLFIHNLGHAAAAYLGWAVRGTTRRSVPRTASSGGGANSGVSGGGASNGAASGMVLTIPEALALPGVEAAVRRAMNEAAAALLREYLGARYPGSYTAEDLAAHIEDLLFRFKNRALGDTVHRVGRDLPRKLARADRLAGAMLLCARHGLPFEGIAAVYRGALGFAAPAEDGSLFPADREFRERYGLAGNAPDPAAPDALAPKALAPGVSDAPGRLERILREVSALDPSRSEDRTVMETVLTGPA